MLMKVSFFLTLHSKRFINLYTIFTHRLKGLSHLIQQIIIQLSYTVRIPIFWLVNLYHVTVGYDATISLTSLSWYALSHKDWELPNSWIWLAETDIDRGLDFPI